MLSIYLNQIIPRVIPQILKFKGNIYRNVLSRIIETKTFITKNYLEIIFNTQIY